MRQKYIVLELSRQNGLTDMKDRFTEFIKISRFMGLIPILPTIYLSSQHTSKEKSILTDYIEIPDFVLSDHETFHSYKPTTEPVDLNEFTQLRLIK